MKPKVCINLRSVLYEDRYHNNKDIAGSLFWLVNGAKELVLDLEKFYDICFYCDKDLWQENSIPCFVRNNFGGKVQLYVADKVPVADFYVGHNYLELPINAEKEDFSDILRKIAIKMENL